jgi:hypothetical protein
MAAHDKARHLETAPRHELGQSLTPHRHRAVRCVNDLAVAGIDQRMARGVQEIAAPQLGRTAYCHDLAERVALHIGVAQYNDAEIAERVLHQPRAVEPEKVRAAPRVRIPRSATTTVLCRGKKSAGGDFISGSA